MDLRELDITEKKEKQFMKKNIRSVEDLLNFFPRKYRDYRTPKNVNTAEIGKKCVMLLTVKDVQKKTSRNFNTYVEASCRDKGTGEIVMVRWFNQSYIYNEIKELYESDVVVAGAYKDDQYGKQFANPDVFSTDIKKHLSIFPIYPTIKGMSDEYLKSKIEIALEHIPEDEYDHELYGKFEIVDNKNLYQKLHHPQSKEDVAKAQKRLFFDELYAFAKKMYEDSTTIPKASTFIPTKLTNTNRFINELPYELTKDQKKVVSDFVETARKGHRVNALIQGDVGCGKTVCAFLLMLTMADNGYQSVLMAPTGVLAKQHYEELKSYVEPMGLSCVYLAGELKAAEKRKVLAQIKSGEADFVIGTHSVISDSVEFCNLGLTVVDEEHKFGVIQRESLRNKAKDGVHSVTMSATPIPRTYALVLYGNSVTMYNIESMPNGRLPVRTTVANNDPGIYKFMHMEIEKGHQCYIVCPLIESDSADYVDEEKPVIESVEDTYRKATHYLGENIKVGMITGKMRDAEKNDIIAKFESNEYQVLIATTIIEVGVNVPNATVITIMNADRFGLAGLHQLRGRVGRSNIQSYCILKSDDKENPRLQVMCETTNGAEIAKRDLELRGTGDFVGTKQSGYDHAVTLMLKFPKFYEKIKNYIEESNKEDLIFKKG